MTCSRQIPSPQQALVIWRTGHRPAHWRAEKETRCAPAHCALNVADLVLRPVTGVVVYLMLYGV
jgi:hypothetical protein